MSIKALFYVVFLPIFLILGLGFAVMLLLGVQLEAGYYNEQACRAQVNSLKHMICSQWTAGIRQGGFELRDRERIAVALERVRHANRCSMVFGFMMANMRWWLKVPQRLANRTLI